jgi:hypothetical protein
MRTLALLGDFIRFLLPSRCLGGASPPALDLLRVHDRFTGAALAQLYPLPLPTRYGQRSRYSLSGMRLLAVPARSAPVRAR